jgi:hypothetical protein
MYRALDLRKLRPEVLKMFERCSRPGEEAHFVTLTGIRKQRKRKSITSQTKTRAGGQEADWRYDLVHLDSIAQELKAITL